MKNAFSPLLRGILVFAILAVAQIATAEESAPESVWQARGSQMTLEIRGDFLPDFGIEIRHQGEPITTRKRLHFPITTIEPMKVHAPWGIFRSLIQGSGRLGAEVDMTLTRGARTVRIDRIELLPGERAGHPLFIAVDDRGNRLFTMSHIHMTLDPDSGSMSAANAEVEASGYLADRLGFAHLEGMPIGLGWIDLGLRIPAGADLTGTPPGCSERPIWPQEGQFEADVSLIGMGNVAYQGTQNGTGLIKTAPSATLKNEGLADIPWIGHFDDLSIYPYTPEDQHPFLVWNIYKISDGRMEMLGASGVKHAFLTINVNCTSCGSSNVLWPECEDTYSSGNNDTSTYQGPRDEIEASLGLWDNCRSFFDPDCTGSQTDFAGQWQNRLLIDPAEFQQPDTQYFMDAWYVIQYDTNIWNGMGFRPIDPSPSGGGWVMNPGAFSQGPVISQWVPENTSDPMADHDVITVPSETPGAAYPDNMPQGHLRLLVKVTETQSGRYRYNYALQNYDFDRAMEGFRIDIPQDATVHDTWFGDIDDDAGNDWNITVNSDHVLFEAPAGNPLTWFTLFNFEIEVEAEPVDSEVRLDLGSDAVMPEMSVETLGPNALMGLLFRDRFEGTSTN
ncbi:MAG: hypothetical protein GVY11_04400 [Gammaproteobacteria bacterium]|jgi:hypothetical protein|nr:hypothetical protein [Gammaproteobacteria bacterium]